MPLHKENTLTENNGEKIEDIEEDEKKKRKRLTKEDIENLETIGQIEAEGRRIYDPLNKIFDHGNKRCTVMVENKNLTFQNLLTATVKLLCNFYTKKL